MDNLFKTLSSSLSECAEAYQALADLWSHKSNKEGQNITLGLETHAKALQAWPHLCPPWNIL